MISRYWRSQIFEKKQNKKQKQKNLGSPNVGQMGQNRAHLTYFLKFGLLVFLEFTYNDSLH